MLLGPILSGLTSSTYSNWEPGTQKIFDARFFHDFLQCKCRLNIDLVFSIP